MTRLVTVSVDPATSTPEGQSLQTPVKNIQYGALLWNKLPEFIKSSTTKDIFKQRVHEICTRKRLFCLLLQAASHGPQVHMGGRLACFQHIRPI